MCLAKRRDPCRVTVFEALVVGHRHRGKMVPFSCSYTVVFLCFFVLYSYKQHFIITGKKVNPQSHPYL